MTRKRNDSHSTKFGLWLREQPEIDSSLGYVATNIDCVWQNYKTGEWMLIEEKRYMAEPSYAQRQVFRVVNKAIRDSKYKGFHLIQFENTTPDDGRTSLDRKEISKEQLISFLQFRFNEVKCEGGWCK